MAIPLAEYTDHHSNKMMDISTYLFLHERMIFLTDTITDEVSTGVVQQIMYLSSVSSDDITMIINSPGGSVSAGLAIFDAMRGVSCDIRTICIGCAASMGAFLLASGTKGKRFSTKNGEIMIHQVIGGAHGQAIDVEIAAAHISRIKSSLNQMLAAHTGQDLERIQRDTDRDYYMTPREAVNYGIIDGIITSIL